MTKSRASIFESVPDVDVSAFAPKARVDTQGPTQAQVKAVAEAANNPEFENPVSKSCSRVKAPVEVFTSNVAMRMS